VSTFGPEWPIKCSGLHVVRKDAIRCTMSLAHASGRSKAPRSYITLPLARRSSPCIATAEWSQFDSAGSPSFRLANVK